MVGPVRRVGTTSSSSGDGAETNAAERCSLYRYGVRGDDTNDFTRGRTAPRSSGFRGEPAS
jgi:hypothetical protein